MSCYRPREKFSTQDSHKNTKTIQGLTLNRLGVGMVAPRFQPVCKSTKSTLTVAIKPSGTAHSLLRSASSSGISWSLLKPLPRHEFPSSFASAYPLPNCPNLVNANPTVNSDELRSPARPSHSLQRILTQSVIGFWLTRTQ